MELFPTGEISHTIQKAALQLYHTQKPVFCEHHIWMDKETLLGGVDIDDNHYSFSVTHGEFEWGWTFDGDGVFYPQNLDNPDFGRLPIFEIVEYLSDYIGESEMTIAASIIALKIITELEY